MQAIWDVEWIDSSVIWADVEPWSSGGWAPLKRKRRRNEDDERREESEEPKPAEVVAPIVRAAPKARPRPDELEEEALMRLREFLEEAQGSVIAAIRAEMDAQREATRLIEQGRKQAEEMAREDRANKARQERESSEEQAESKRKAREADAAMRAEEDAVTKLLAQRKQAARKAIAEAQKHLIGLLGLKNTAL